ncbi:MAG: hypothetical protein ACI9OJ_000643 [Myxococcota bacterium]|jgi:uncharacterized protein YfaS (alpha-2-macroglobulin family)
MNQNRIAARSFSTPWTLAKIGWLSAFLALVLVTGCTKKAEEPPPKTTADKTQDGTDDGPVAPNPKETPVTDAPNPELDKPGKKSNHPAAPPQPKTPTPTPGFQFELDNADAQPEAQERPKAAQAEKLDAKATKELLGRLEALELQDGDAPTFAFRKRSLKPPVTGKTVKGEFPPKLPTDAAKPTTDGEPLKVARFSPEGDVPLAPKLSVTFSAPMVAVTSHDELKKRPVPVKLTPEIEGKWRWVGARNLAFETTGRLPMATVFTATVPAGTTSVNGDKLAESVSWTFQTPPPRLRTQWPTNGPHGLDPVIVMSFDQRIDADAVRKNLILTAGGKTVKFKVPTQDELKADRDASRRIDGFKDGTWLAIKATRSLPKDSSIEITIQKGTPSAEGPRTTGAPQSFSFRTYAPFIVEEVKCGWRGDCPPFSPWTIKLNNPVDKKLYEDSMVSVSPKVEGHKTRVSGSRYIEVSGRTKGSTKYKVHISKKLTDKFGQTLGKNVSWDVYVSNARPWLSTPGGDFVVLDPASTKPEYPIYSINHESVEVTLRAVEPKDYNAFRTYSRRAGDLKKRPPAPGKIVWQGRVEIDQKKDELVETQIDLSAAMPEGLGQVVVEIEPTKQAPNKWRREVKVLWVQRTKLAVDAFHDDSDLKGFVTNLADGSPVAGATVELVNGGERAKTDSGGFVSMPLPKSSSDHNILVARLGKDVAILPESNYHWSSGGTWVKRDVVEQLRWYVIDDRNLYKPKEKVHFKGWMRLVTSGKAPDIAALAGGVGSVAWKVSDPRGNEIAKGTSKVNEFGGFHADFELPDNANLGWATIHLSAMGGSAGSHGRSHTHRFQLQEFRRPEFEVKSNASEGPHFVGGKAQLEVTAAYFAGGGLPDTEVRWSVGATLTNFTPPNRHDYNFGVWTPWWSRDGHTPSSSRSFVGRTDGQGTHRLGLDFQSVEPARPASISASATIVDVNRQTWTTRTNLLVHPADVYVGLKSKRAFVEAGTDLDIELIATDLDGKAVAGRPIAVKTVRMEWISTKGTWTQEEKDEQRCKRTSGDDPVKCTVKTAKGGTYITTVTVTDAQGRKNMTRRRFWVSGGKRPVAKKVELEKVTLIPDKENYQPGDVAEILVQSPFTPASGRMMVRATGILTESGFAMDGPTHTLKIKITEEHIPSVKLEVYLAGAALRPGKDGDPDPKLPKRAAFASGTLSLKVPPLKRTLTVKVAPKEDQLEPGGSTDVVVTVTDADGKPVSEAEVALIVVDEAVLALNGYKAPDPIGVFYRARPELGGRRLLRGSVLLAELDNLDLSQAADKMTLKPTSVARMKSAESAPPSPAAMPAPPGEAVEREESMAGDDEGGSGGDEKPGIKVRKNFDPLALFLPEAPTNAAGQATATVTLPDNLTRYRITAVVVEKAKRFGYGESAITARLPLMVRPSAPRFLNFGDTFELPVVLQNQTNQPMEVTVAVRALGMKLTDGQGRKLTIGPSDRVEVRFPTAVSRVGTGRIQIAAAAGKWGDAANIELPIWTPATTEAFATYGTLDDGAIVQPVRAPENVVKEFGGLEVTTSSTALQALTDAVLYLVSYPYECSEQLASRVLAVAALRDVLTAFKAEGLPPAKDIIASVERDLKKLARLQRRDGGFAFWRAGDPGWPYLSVHVAHALTRAKAKGFDVPAQMLARSKTYLQGIERHFPSYYSKRVRWTIEAYAVNVRHQMGDSDPAKARTLISNFGGPDKTSLEALGWLLPVISKDPASAELLTKVRRHLNNRVTETAGNAHFVTSYGDGAHLLLHSDRRADGILLEAYIADQPKSDVIPKLVRGLLAHRKRGRWGNTQENAFILLALDRYFNTYEKETPDFVARLWLGDKYAGEHKFKGRTTERHQVDIPMAQLAETKGDQPLTIGKDGPGRLYYRIGMRYAPSDLKVPAADHGFVVERTYEGADDPSDVTRQKDGTWIVKAGARVRVRVTMVAESRRYHVALVDPLPAGLEPLNAALRGTEDVPEDHGAQSGKSGSRSPWSHRRWGRWYEHSNLRDERAEAFTSLLWDGVYTYSYLARATTPGNFVVPPAKAEEMYAPETFGRSAGDRVIVQ